MYVYAQQSRPALPAGRQAFISFLAVLALSAATPGYAQQASFAAEPPRVDLVIALDVSNSMDGLINSARQRLWDIVAELGRAQPQPKLRVALVTYGNPDYGQDSGFVRINQPFTDNLDAVNAALFELRTNGGSEYVARALDSALRDLQWSPGNALRIAWVAGNESASQDPQLTLTDVLASAARRGILVNALFCGPAGHQMISGWQLLARATNGEFASINQDAAAVATRATPMDDELARLNTELNTTYVALGAEGERARKRQQEQDEVVAEMSAPAAASRTAVKASGLYQASWDLLDTLASGRALESIAADDLPEPLQAMAEPERRNWVDQQSVERKRLRSEIGVVAAKRRAWLDARPAEATGGLDAAMKDSLRRQGTAHGLNF